VLAELERRRPGRFRLEWAGTGDRAGAVRERGRHLGVGDRVDLLGFVPFGEELLSRYRAAHAFVHVSLTEGVPQVLVEAFASSTPIVATDVGGVRSALADGEAGLLVPPDDRDALVDAVLRLTDDPDLRGRLVARGLELAHRLTREAQSRRAAIFVDESAT
jgi:glycosyltransferase involved in cell wall biosynthesis